MESILMKIYEHYTGEGRDLLLHAYDFAKEAHANQKRASGEPYFIHPCSVAEILVDLGLDTATIAGALLHDVIEDTPNTEEDIRREFGDEILSLVAGVTKLDKFVFKSREEEEAENFRKIFVAMAKDIRVIIIKLADRLHNMRSLNYLSKERQIKMAQETLDIYAPLAGRLGISQIKCELEDLCLKYLDPEAFEYLVANIHLKLEQRMRFVDTVVEEINALLVESNIHGEVFGRPKHFYSIYRKMKTKNRTLDQIYDLTAVRVIVATVEECYEVLGKLHSKWNPMPGRIKDYIATPKPNLYQSLHTTVMTNFGQPFEIQIRTEEMHRTAEYGIAAHWKYKENRSEETSLDERIAWIREAMEWQGDLKDSKEFLESMKNELYSSELLVFTPQGKVISLPEGSTPIDFAYAIHSEVGNKCTGAKVNGRIVPLSSKLEIGDMVEILTTPGSKGPSRDWLKIVKSSSARAKIKSFFRKQMKEENIKIGKTILEEAAKHRGENLSEILTEESFKHVAERMSFTSFEDMYASVGYGSVTANQVLAKLLDFQRKNAPIDHPAPIFAGKRAKGSVVLNGMTDLLVGFAGCCSPVPGDEIVGYVTRGRGVVIHRRDCPNLKNVEPDRLQKVEWSGESGRFKAGIVVIASEQESAISAISASVNEMKLGISSIQGRYDKAGNAVVDVSITLNNRQDVEILLKKIRTHAKIIDVRRATEKNESL